MTRLPRDAFYGICTGRGEDAPDGDVPLTDWLTANVNDIAGLAADGPPLTFADLTSRGVNLRVVTTNLSHGEPYVLPRAKNTFIFQVDEWRRLFPDSVIAHLVQKAPLQHMALARGLLLPAQRRRSAGRRGHPPQPQRAHPDQRGPALHGAALRAHRLPPRAQRRARLPL